MKRYLCPICDQELKGRSYCVTCRRVVRYPLVYDGVLPNEDNGNYLLNHDQIHPGKHCVEANQARTCETPQEKHQEARFTQQTNSGQSKYAAQQRTGASGTVYQPYRGQQSTAPGSQIWKSSTSGSSTYSGSARSTSGSSHYGNGKKKRRSGCLTLFIIFWIIGILANVVSELDTESWFVKEEEYVDESMMPDIVVQEQDAVPESLEGMQDIWETLDYEEILAAGEHCSGYLHCPISGAEVYQILTEFTEVEMGLAAVGQSEEMYNCRSSSEYGDYTCYSRYRHLDWDAGFVSVDSDSVTDEIHYIGVYSWAADEAIEIAVKVFSVVDDESYTSALRNALYEALEGEDIQEGYMLSMGNCSVWIAEDLGEIMIEIVPAEE